MVRSCVIRTLLKESRFPRTRDTLQLRSLATLMLWPRRHGMVLSRSAPCFRNFFFPGSKNSNQKNNAVETISKPKTSIVCDFYRRGSKVVEARSSRTGLIYMVKSVGGFLFSKGFFFSIPSAPMILRSSSSSSSSSSLPSPPSIVTLLKRCKTESQLQQVHTRIIRKGLEQDRYLISMLLSSSSSPSYSSSVFDRISQPCTLLWNCLIGGYAQRSLFLESLSLFMRMRREGVAEADDYTFSKVLKVCSSLEHAPFGSAVHGLILRLGFDKDVYIASSLVDLYGKCSDILSARKVFGEMPDRNVVSWTALLVAYVKVGNLEEAKKVFDLMPHRNARSWNALIDGLAKAGDLVNARKVFDKMPERDIKSYTSMIDGYAKKGDMASATVLFEQAGDVDIVAWSALISGYVQNGQPSEAMKIYLRMRDLNIVPDEFIITSVMAACSQLGSLELCQSLNSYLCQSSVKLSSQQHVMAAWIDMNAKCGDLDRALKLFEKMPRRDLISYCSMMQGLNIHGRGDLAVQLFEKMINEGIIPDKAAFTVILTACSHAGLVDEGLRYFGLIQNEYSIAASPDHYACVVDLLGRSGKLQEAYELIMAMPVEPHACVWGALLNACNLHCNNEIGEIAANRLIELEPQNAGNFVLLSNIWATSGRWPDVAQLRDRMKETGIKKICGCSWISR
ncbi:PREDICTED: putative pentatricopeptide repeat-containing protein At5g37570 [Tarenaya hassleriana]|uniref:putative pentatricopeptide repeat-containing protein At5g37570 n=1 Tax=Tarenaya hassleriana TaxID=28532 RepID=UPI0008FCFEF6|nr:PREDICTED: putative pentatricopeptide repeat-containing protein At5g37570 [Tarenaya hassleriana]XP_019057044.1 PREDICTED: putative pentatricopeptide repeat-containing protein At5g37570 [Tarenaya hassleriana]XP_019057045.1 PREDICTED: putative pentatricopeptide repeat-containing protein At5g37570 [Tarenaya hassleriana]